MEKDPHQHIHQATDKRLAEMLKKFNCWRRDYQVGMPMPFSAEELGVILDEAARRLENYQPRETFNHEQFNCP